MATIVGGIGATHSPVIAFAKDTNKQDDPGWSPIFKAFATLRDWVDQNEVDCLVTIFNDHVTSFFFDHYSAFALGLDDIYYPADEGGGPRDVKPLNGHAALARHIGHSLVADEFDMSFFQGKRLDHGCFSPLSMLMNETGELRGTMVPLQVGVLQFPIPSARRCYKLGKSLRKAIQSFPEDLRVAVVGTGGLSHQVHGERTGYNNPDWDEEFLTLLETEPETLADLTIAEYARRGGVEGAEVIMWLIMRGALSDTVRRVHASTYLPAVTNIGTVIFEDLGSTPEDSALDAYRDHVGYQMEGAGALDGSYPFTLEQSSKAYRLNDFLHRLIHPDHRQQFVSDPEALMTQYGLSDLEKTMIRDRQWIELIRYGAIFFVLEKMAAVIGVPSQEVYASMRGEDVETFKRSRNVSMTYSVAGGEKAEALDKQ